MQKVLFNLSILRLKLIKHCNTSAACKKLICTGDTIGIEHSNSPLKH